MVNKTFKLIGHKIKNSASPFIHNEIFKHLNKSFNFSYSLLDTAPNEFDHVFSNLNRFSGVNITAPYKVRAFNWLKQKSRSARHFGCVNTIKTLPNGELKGFCTDGFGFLKSLQTLQTEFFENVLILGFGGAGQVAARCLENKCSNLFVSVRNLKNVPKNFRTKAKFVCSSGSKIAPEILNTSFQLVVNATPCGNANNVGSVAINLAKLKKVDNVFDLIYFPLETKLLKQAQLLGAKTLNGVNMLAWQAMAAEKIWNNNFSLSTTLLLSLTEKTKKFLENKKL